MSLPFYIVERAGLVLLTMIAFVSGLGLLDYLRASLVSYLCEKAGHAIYTSDPSASWFLWGIADRRVDYNEFRVNATLLARLQGDPLSRAYWRGRWTLRTWGT